MTCFNRRKKSRNFRFFEVPKDLFLSAGFRSFLGTQKKFLILKNSATQLYLRSRALFASLTSAIAFQSDHRNLEVQP